MLKAAWFVVLYMAVLPLLELFDRWKARHTIETGNGGAIPTDMRFGWARIKGEPGEFFWFVVPYVRAWEQGPMYRNFDLSDPVFCWHRQIIVHAKGVRSAPNGWSSHWTPIDDASPPY